MTEPAGELLPGAGVTPEDISSVREAQEEMMPEVVVIYDRVPAPDGRGGTKVTYPELAPPLSPTIGRVGTVRDQVAQQFASQLRGKATAILTVPVGAAVVQQRRVLVLGGVYDVVADLSRSSYATAARFLIEEV